MANRIRVYSLARELNLSNNEIIAHAKSLGADAATASSTLDGPIANRIRELNAASTKQQPPRGRGQPRAAQPGKPRHSEDSPPTPQESPRPRQSAIPAPAVPRQRSHRQSPGHPVASAKAEPSPGASAPPEIAIESAAPPHSKTSKKYYLIDGLNVCNWQKTPSLAPLLTLLIVLKRQGHQILCIFDANSRFVFEELGEREKYEHLVAGFDCFGEVPGGTQADDFLLFRAHKTGDAIISNDQYRDPKYRERYRWLRSVSPRLYKGIVLGGFLILPELDVHAPVRESLAAIIKEFEAEFGSPRRREQSSRPAQRSHSRSQSKPQIVAEVAPPAVRPATPPPEPPSAPSEQPAAVAEGNGDADAPRRRGRRRRGRRGGRGRNKAPGV